MAPEADFRTDLWALTCGRYHALGYLRQMVVEASVEQLHLTRRTMKTTCSPAKVLTAVSAMMLAGSLVGCGALANDFEIIGAAPEVTADAPAPAGDAANALVQLESIPVKGRASKTGYTRTEFGPAWADVDRNGCDSRNDILARDMTNETFKPGTNNCVVMTGTLTDKYTGTTITLTRGQDTSSTTSLPSAMRGRRAPNSSTPTSARNLLTTRSISWLLTAPPTVPKAIKTQPRGCRQTELSDASTSPAKPPSRRNTVSGSHKRRAAGISLS